MAHHGKAVDCDGPTAADTFPRSTRSLPRRLIRAARLERRLYAEVRSDHTATALAWATVSIANWYGEGPRTVEVAFGYGGVVSRWPAAGAALPGYPRAGRG